MIKYVLGGNKHQFDLFFSRLGERLLRRDDFGVSLTISSDMAPRNINATKRKMNPGVYFPNITRPSRAISWNMTISGAT